MANFAIDSSNSITTTANGIHAFAGDTAGADSLTVAQGAYLIATGVGSSGAFLARSGGWIVTINGLVKSEQFSGLAFDTSLSRSSVSIGSNGEIIGVRGIFVENPVTILNAGKILGSSAGLFTQGGSLTVRNSGVISGNDFSIVDNESSSIDNIINTGTLDGSVSLGGKNDMLTSSGTINGYVDLGYGDDRLTNSGIIHGAVFGRSGNDLITNAHTIKGFVDLGIGRNTLRNSGTIDGAVFCDAGDDTVTNSGLIRDTIFFAGGNDKLINSGPGVIEGDVISSSGTDLIVNLGTIFGSVDLGADNDSLKNSNVIYGNVFAGGGNDVFTNKGGVLGYIDLGEGDDAFNGGKGSEIVRDGAGSDIVRLGGGNDIYDAVRSGGVDGTDIIDGGAGIDTYYASLATGRVEINLDTVAHDYGVLNPGVGAVAAKTAGGVDVAGAFKDVITGFENAHGGQGNDLIYGNAAGNALIGGSGSDVLFGGGGNDVLMGETGNDGLIGGAGMDTMFGGAGADQFYFTAVSDSGVTEATRDEIADFESGFDVIFLYHIDANTTNGATNDAFDFIGTNTNFTGIAGQLRAYWTDNGQIVEGDVNGDGKADFSIALRDPNHAISLTAADFIL